MTVSSRINRMAGVLISRYIQYYAILFVSYSFDMQIIDHYFVTKSHTETGFSVSESSLYHIINLFSMFFKRPRTIRLTYTLLLRDITHPLFILILQHHLLSEKMPWSSHNALLPIGYFVQVVMWVLSDKTYLKTKIGRLLVRCILV